MVESRKRFQWIFFKGQAYTSLANVLFFFIKWNKLTRINFAIHNFVYCNS